jgi:Na+:H+ antiporter, NhaC family|tara:strand:+ start:38350 stop:39777 length:1428 start_codon:yes stop_codon:yes gene_type:complete
MKVKNPTFIQSIIPIIFLIFLLGINVSIFGDLSLDGSNQIVLIFSASLAASIAYFNGIKWKVLQEGIVNNISSATPSILILLLVGSLAGSWMISGIVPSMIYYGIQILSPDIFLFAACIICIVVSLATGSSWTTSATVGIALMGIGKSLGIDDGFIAGAVLSGAYFGDKMSPLSDTTNLAPAVSGTTLFKHIRYLSYTTIPSISICLLILLISGFLFIEPSSFQNSLSVADSIKEKFYISPILFIPPSIVIFLIYKKVPAIPSLFSGILLGVIFAIIFQADIIHEVSLGNEKNWISTFSGIMISLYGNISIETSNSMVSNLLSSSGMFGMLSTIWLIFSAMIFGGVMEKGGFLSKIAEVILNRVKSTGSLVVSTASSCVFFNITASDQYLSIVIPGKMYSNSYKERGLAPENLSRTLEDSGTVTSVLIPWNTCGAYHSGVLGVSTLTYLPYCFFNIISPIMTILFAYLKIKIKKL